MQNPFTTTFSKTPKYTYISTAGAGEIIKNFSYDDPSESVYKITGVRGSGKTVLLAKVEDEYKSDTNQECGWLVYRLSPARDMLQQLAAKLHKEPFIRGASGIKGINISASVLGSGGGIGVSREDDGRFYDIGTEIEEMLGKAAKSHKKILLGIDEVSKTKEMIVFASEYGKWLRGGFPIYLVCTGLYENIQELCNVKNLTFFRRAATVQTEPLSFVRMSEVYRRTLEADITTAKKLASLTKGYAYAFQVLGVMYFKNMQDDNFKIIPDDTIPRPQSVPQGSSENSSLESEGIVNSINADDEIICVNDEMIEDAAAKLREELYACSYEKIWEEMTDGDRYFVSLLTEKEEYRREEVIMRMGDKAGVYSVYRDRLLKRGILQAKRGCIGLSLPFFGDYIRDYQL